MQTEVFWRGRMACHWARITGLCFILTPFDACLDPQLQGVLYIARWRKACKLGGAEGSSVPYAHLILSWLLWASHPLVSSIQHRAGHTGASLSGWWTDGQMAGLWWVHCNRGFPSLGPSFRGIWRHQALSLFSGENLILAPEQDP